MAGRRAASKSKMAAGRHFGFSESRNFWTVWARMLKFCQTQALANRSALWDLEFLNKWKPRWRPAAILDFVSAVLCEPFELRRSNFTGWKPMPTVIRPNGLKSCNLRKNIKDGRRQWFWFWEGHNFWTVWATMLKFCHLHKIPSKT